MLDADNNVNNEGIYKKIKISQSRSKKIFNETISITSLNEVNKSRKGNNEQIKNVYIKKNEDKSKFPETINVNKDSLQNVSTDNCQKHCESRNKKILQSSTSKNAETVSTSSINDLKKENNAHNYMNDMENSSYNKSNVVVKTASTGKTLQENLLITKR